MKNNKKTIIIVSIIVVIIILRAIIYFTSLKPKTYVEKNDIMTDVFTEKFKLDNLLFNYDDEKQAINYDNSESVEANYLINNVNVDASNKDNYRKIVVDYSINANGYLHQEEDGTITNMKYVYFSLLEVFDSYTGKMLNIRDKLENGSLNGSMKVTWEDKNYTIYLNRTIILNSGDEIIDNNIKYYPQELKVIDEIEIPINYRGLLLGFNSIKNMKKNDILEYSKKEYYILDRLQNTSKLFKVEM